MFVTESSLARGRKTPAMRRVEEAYGIDLERELQRRYWDEGQSTSQIGRAFDHDATTILGWLRRLGIPTRPKNGREGASS